MLLTVDIGNSTTRFGVFRGARLLRTFSRPTALWRATRERGRIPTGLAEQAIICSVVPWAAPKIRRSLRAAGCCRIALVGREITVPLKNRYRHPRQVGQDRLVGAFAAWTTYQRDCIVADFGTAITIDLVTRKGDYLGGLIAPGLEMSLEALASRAALLPRVRLSSPRGLLGRDTAGSIRSGIVYGASALCDGLIEALKARYAAKAKVIGTGGGAGLISRYARQIDLVQPNLVLRGLQILAQSKSCITK